MSVLGAIIAGGVVEIIVGATGLVGRMLRFVGPITIAPTIALIGLSLFIGVVIWLLDLILQGVLVRGIPSLFGA